MRADARGQPDPLGFVDGPSVHGYAVGSPSMAYDEALAQRLRDGLRRTKGLSEKRMMGGLCVLVNGNMLCGVDRAKAGGDRFMFRVGKANEADALRRPGASIVEMGGKRLGGLVFVDAGACDQPALKAWLALALGFVGKLPAK